MKQKPKLTRVEKKKLYKTVERFNRIKKENNRAAKAIKLNNDLNNQER